jgi:hypothetical protein
MSEKEYFEFIEQYLEMFRDKEPEREKLDFDSNLLKL